MSDKSNLGQSVLTVLILSLFVIPPIIMLLRKTSRLWIKAGVEGDNGRLDLTEVWEMLYMFLAIGSFFLLAYMIINKTLYNVDYSTEEYLFVFTGTLGSNTASVVITYLKQKYAK